MSGPSREQVLALTDATGLRAGQGQAVPTRWTDLGTDGAHAWGQCKGSGASPYQLSADLTDLATSCSCPSRKFPCKHAVGLLLLLADGAVPPGDAAPWTAAWRDKRAQRIGRTPAEPTPENAAARAAAAARRAASRESKVDEGVATLQRWLEDLVRGGFAAAGTAPPATFATTAARMVDAQAPGLAERVRTLSRLAATSGTDQAWSQRMLDTAGSTALLLRGWQRRASLDERTQRQVAVRIGFPVGEPDERVQDTWTLLGYDLREDDRFTTRQQWLLGRRSRRLVTVLEFAAPGSALGPGLPDGDAELELALHAGPLPARAAAPASTTPGRAAGPPVLPASWTLGLGAYRELLAEDPWTDRTVIGCAAAALLPGEPWLVRDREGRALPLVDDGRPLRALAHTGAHPTALAGEWDGRSLRVLGVEDDRGHWVVLR